MDRNLNKQIPKMMTQFLIITKALNLKNYRYIKNILNLNPQNYKFLR
jgi:hypothetical protein